jgi:hypothetical protein
MTTAPFDAASSSPQAGAARYRAALRCAAIRRQGWTGGHVIHRWSWLFPGILASALGWVVGAATAGPAPPPPVLEGPRLGGAPDPEPIVIYVTRSRILFGEEPTPVILLPEREVLVASGVEAKYKRSPGDLFLVPLAEAVEAEGRRKGDDRPLEAVVIADASTPYRLLVEILFTLGQSDVGKYHLMVRAKR